LRLRSAVTSSASSGLNIASAAYRKNSEKMVNANCVTHAGCAGVPELLPKSSCFLSLKVNRRGVPVQDPEPALSPARSEDVLVDSVMWATGRT